MVNGEPQMLFSKTSFKVSRPSVAFRNSVIDCCVQIETGEAERISVDHVAHITGTGTQEGSQFTAHLTGIHSAIKMLSI